MSSDLTDTEGGQEVLARGALRTYLGMAPGVGKSYAMFRGARARRQAGCDAVAACWQRHGRLATAAQLGDLDVVPARAVTYRGKSAQELDVAAVLERRPELALVDQLAHASVPAGVTRSGRARAGMLRRRALRGRGGAGPATPCHSADVRVLVIGAGIAGLTLAGRLCQQGRTPVIVERSVSPDSGYAIGLYPLGPCVLHGIGAYEELERRALALQRYELASATGRVLQSFDMTVLTAAAGPLHMVTRAELLGLLEPSCHQAELRRGVMVASLAASRSAPRPNRGTWRRQCSCGVR